MFIVSDVSKLMTGVYVSFIQIVFCKVSGFALLGFIVILEKKPVLYDVRGFARNIWFYFTYEIICCHVDFAVAVCKWLKKLVFPISCAARVMKLSVSRFS